MTTSEIVAELTRTPLHRIEAAKAVDGIPAQPGVYAWWSTRGAIPGVPATTHASEPYELLYVGIVPRDADSSARLRSRLCDQHVGGNIGSSTFRFAIAALLWEREGWTPCRSPAGKYRLGREDNRSLSAWQREHLRLRWAVVAKPWLFEEDVIGDMAPPLNRDHNQDHPFYASMGLARQRLRNAALSV